MPHKYNTNRRRRIPKPHYKVTNGQAYEAGLRQRGSLIFWFTGEAIAAWWAAPRITPGGQTHYSDLAVETALMLWAVVLKQMLDLGRPGSVRGG
jgi:hypothetical protein